MLSCTSGFRISKNKNGGDNLPQRYELIAYSDTYGYFFISSSLLKLRDSMMSNANTEYNILAVTSLEHRNTTLGYISLLFFFWREREGAFTGLSLLMTEIHPHVSPAVFSLKRMKPGTDRSGSDLTVPVSAA